MKKRAKIIRVYCRNCGATLVRNHWPNMWEHLTNHEKSTCFVGDPDFVPDGVMFVFDEVMKNVKNNQSSCRYCDALISLDAIMGWRHAPMGATFCIGFKGSTAWPPPVGCLVISEERKGVKDCRLCKTLPSGNRECQRARLPVDGCGSWHPPGTLKIKAEKHTGFRGQKHRISGAISESV